MEIHSNKSVNCLSEASKAKRNMGALIGSFNGNNYNWILTIKLLKKVENGGLSSTEVMSQIVDLFIKYSKATIIKTAYELDASFQLHQHIIVSGPKKVNGYQFTNYLHRRIEASKHYYFHMNSILTAEHWTHAHKYLDKEDQTTVHQRYQQLIIETAYVLPMEDPESPESDHEPYEPVDIDFID